MFIYIYIYIYVCMYAFAGSYTCMYINPTSARGSSGLNGVYTSNPCPRPLGRGFTPPLPLPRNPPPRHTYACMYMHAYACIYVHAYICVHTYACIHMHAYIISPTFNVPPFCPTLLCIHYYHYYATSVQCSILCVSLRSDAAPHAGSHRTAGNDTRGFELERVGHSIPYATIPAIRLA